MMRRLITKALEAIIRRLNNRSKSTVILIDGIDYASVSDQSAGHKLFRISEIRGWQMTKTKITWTDQDEPTWGAQLDTRESNTRLVLVEVKEPRSLRVVR